MISGQLTLNGITDAHLITILEIKERHREMVFNPAILQMVPRQMPQQQALPQTYNNVVLSWTTENGLEGVKEILHRLTHKPQ